MFESKPAVSVPMCAAKMFCIMASLQLQYPTSNTKLIYLKFQHSNSARHLCFRQVKEQAMLPFCVPCRHIGEAEVQPSSSLISALDGVIEHHHDPVALPPGKKPASDFKGGFWAPGPSWRIWRRQITYEKCATPYRVAAHSVQTVFCGNMRIMVEYLGFGKHISFVTKLLNITSILSNWMFLFHSHIFV